jgi:hypothetical protein
MPTMYPFSTVIAIIVIALTLGGLIGAALAVVAADRHWQRQFDRLQQRMNRPMVPQAFLDHLDDRSRR